MFVALFYIVDIYIYLCLFWVRCYHTATRCVIIIQISQLASKLGFNFVDQNQTYFCKRVKEEQDQHEAR